MMKKLILSVLMLVTFPALADVIIECPDAPGAVFYSKQWNIRLREQYNATSNTNDQ